MHDTHIALSIENLRKSFTLHTRGGLVLPIFSGIDLTVRKSECVALVGPSGSGKSTLIRCIYGNYLPQSGSIRVWHDGAMVDLVDAAPQLLLDVRRRTIGFVSQFLRVIPRVATLEVVMEPLRALGVHSDEVHDRAAAILTRLNIPEWLWSVPPATFSGGEQQRVNIARSLVVEYPVLLLDEPTASLDPANREIVLEMINEARSRGAAVVGIFHDANDRTQVAMRELNLAAWRSAA